MKDRRGLNNMSYENATKKTGANYNPNTDYMSLIQQAQARGDTQAAAYYEQQRNAKIAAQMAQGNNTYAGSITNNYAGVDTNGFSPSYRQYLENGYGNAPKTWTDETLVQTAPTAAQAIASLEAAGNYEQANAIRNQWNYTKDYTSGNFVQGAQKDMSGLTQQQYESLNAGGQGAADTYNNLPTVGGYADALQGGKQTTTYIDDKGDKQTGIVAGSSYLDSMLNQLNLQYQQQIAQANNAAAAATRKAILALEQQKSKLDQQYKGMYEQLYINRRMNEKALPEQLAAMGYTGGLTESALLQLQNNYQNNVRQGEVARMQGVLDLDAAIAEAQLTGDLERANALMELSGQYYTNYAQAMQLLQQQQNAQREREAENAWVLLENGIMPNANGLAAMGLTAEQAQALMGGSTGYSGNPDSYGSYMTTDANGKYVVANPTVAQQQAWAEQQQYGTMYEPVNNQVAQILGRNDRSTDAGQKASVYLQNMVTSGRVTAEGAQRIATQNGFLNDYSAYVNSIINGRGE